MASSTLVPYQNNTATTTFSLVSTSDASARWIVSGRSLSNPWAITQSVKLNKGVGNDVIELSNSRVEANATTGKLATCLVKLSVSIPKDQTVLDATAQRNLVAQIASLINDATAVSSSAVNRVAMIEGRML